MEKKKKKAIYKFADTYEEKGSGNLISFLSNAMFVVQWLQNVKPPDGVGKMYKWARAWLQRNWTALKSEGT